jgi:hypothetical protein
MKRSTSDVRPLFDPWLTWQELPDAVRQHALDVLTALYLSTVEPQDQEHETHDPSHDQATPFGT